MLRTGNVLDWLLQGDIAVAYQVKRDLQKAPPEELSDLRKEIPRQGWGAALLQARRSDGHWGEGFYRPKWTSTHYTLLELKGLGTPETNQECSASTSMIFADSLGRDGGVNYAKTVKDSDVCINGMALGLGVYFKTKAILLESPLDFLLRTQMADGGWNCEHLRGAVHSSVHTTLSVLEGLTEYLEAGIPYRSVQVLAARERGEEFLLQHRLYLSHRTGRIMDPKMTRLSYPPRWRYDILRALEYFRSSGRLYDSRMDCALELLLKKRRKDGTWPLQMKHPGKTHFEMEKVGRPSRWNTLRALRVLEHFGVAAG